jgi:hypothetical protein
VTTSEGRPDLVIQTIDCLVYIEAKVESGLGHRQLDRYRSELKQSGLATTGLVLLTRYPVSVDASEAKPDVHIRWHEVAQWLEVELGQQSITNQISKYLVEQFIGFLKARNMTMEQVGWELGRGIQALQNLLDMLYEVASACKVQAEKQTSWEDIGYNLDKRKYWVGIHYPDQPVSLAFFTRCPIDKSKAERLGIGQVRTDVVWAADKMAWANWLSLDSEEIHFFARSKASQMQCLETFLMQCLEAARSIQSGA